MNLDTKRVPKHRPGNHAVPAGPLAPAMHTTQHGACHVDRDPATEVLTLGAEFRLNEVRHLLSHSAMLLQGFSTLSAQPVSARFAAPFNKRFLTSRCQLGSGSRHLRVPAFGKSSGLPPPCSAYCMRGTHQGLRRNRPQSSRAHSRHTTHRQSHARRCRTPDISERLGGNKALVSVHLR